MKLIRVQILKSRDQLQAGGFYNLPQITALSLAEQGFALLPEEIKPAGPSEIKPTGPSEIKTPEVRLKKNSTRGKTAKES